MKKIFLSVFFSIFLGVAFGQLSQFRMIGSGSWTTVNDSTFSSTVTIQSDLTSNGFLPTGITDSMFVFTQTGQRYRISSATNLTFSSADLSVVERGGNWGVPVGQFMIYEDNGRDAVPAIPFGATGATAKLQEAVVTYNSSIESSISDGDKGDIVISGSGANYVIDSDAVTAAKIVTGAVGADELASTAVTPGTYTNLNATIDADGRITAAANGTGGSGASIDSVRMSNDTLMIFSGLDTFYTSLLAENIKFDTSRTIIDSAKVQGAIEYVLNETTLNTARVQSAVEAAQVRPLDERTIPYPAGSNGRTAVSYILVDESSADLAEAFSVDTALAIVTTDGNPSVTHPSVLYASDSIFGYKYWMLFTPYPAEARENPEINVSQDGINWDTITGGTNPLDATPISGWNSDTDLEFVNDTLYAIWNEHISTTNKNFYYRKSGDGLTWSTEVLFSNFNYNVASPTLEYHRNRWLMWWVDVRTNGEHKVWFRSATTLEGLNAAVDQACTFSTPLMPYISSISLHMWHIEVKFDSLEDQFVALFNYTQSGLPAPNNNGKLAYATSTDGLNFDVRDEIFNFPDGMYRSSLVRTDSATVQGAAFEMYYAPQWNIRRSLLFLKPRVNTEVFDYDGISADTLGAVYSLRYRRTNWLGMPVARVLRPTGNVERDIYPNGVNGLILADSTTIETWLGSDTARVMRLYNQVGGGDYMYFPTDSMPLLIDTLWNGQESTYGIHFDGVKTIAENRNEFQFPLAGISSPVRIDNTGGQPFGGKAGASYLGMNGSNMTLLASANINYARPYSVPGVFTGVFGSSAYINENGDSKVTGSTSDPSTGKLLLGARYATTVYSSPFEGVTPEIVYWKETPTTAQVDIVEASQISEYAYTPPDSVFDDFTGQTGRIDTSTLVTGQSWEVSDTFWLVQGDTLIAEPGHTDPRLTAVVDVGASEGVFEGTVYRKGSNGSGIVVRYQDNDNFYYIRLFNGTSVLILKYTGGSLTTHSGATITEIPEGEAVNYRVEIVGDLWKVYVNDALVITTTESSFSNATKFGFHDNGLDQEYDNFKFQAY